MAKGIVFTLDATIALLIFISSTAIFYSFFTDTSSFGLRAPDSYADAQTYFAIYDENDEESILCSYSDMYRYHQLNDDNFALGCLNMISEVYDYENNMKLYVWTGGDFDEILSVGGNDFSEKIVTKRYLVFALTSNKTNILDPNIIFEANSLLIGKKINWAVDIYNPLLVDADVDVVLTVMNGTNILYEYTESLTVKSEKTKKVGYSNIDTDDLLIGQYRMIVNVTGDFDAYEVQYFNLVDYGFLEVEVGYE